MHKLFYVSMAVVFTSCLERPKNPVLNHEDTVATAKSVATSNYIENPLPEKIIAERLKGTVTVLDTINGQSIATLEDNILLNAGVPKNGWVVAGIEVEITPVQDKNMQLKRGDGLLIKGKPVGEVLEDVHLEITGQEPDGGRTGLFYGYIPVGKIKTGSVIETALGKYMESSNRMLSDMQLFIKQFELKTTNFNEPFLEYANYESTVDDPSPLYRTVLVFYKNKLIAVVASRPTKLKGTTEQKLERGFHGYFYTDTDVKLQQEYIKMFNAFINSVD